MTRSDSPRVDARDERAVVEQLRAMLPGYVPEWTPSPGGPGAAVVQVFARYSQVLIERLNQAPDRNKLAFLDMLGSSLLPAQAGRAPVVFTAVPNTGDGRVPAHTRVGAKVAGRADPLIFETATDIALAGARLAEVVTVLPGSDGFANHSTAAIGGEPFTLFTPLTPIPHELYLAHDTLFAIAGSSTVEVQFAISSTASEPLPLAWEYWDGHAWRRFRPFKAVEEATSSDSLDGTQGLTRSGTIRLCTDCAESRKRKVNGVESFWIRARLDRPSPDQAGRVWPRIDRINIRSTVSRPLWRMKITTTRDSGAGNFAAHGSVFRDAGARVELDGPGFSDARAATRSETAGEWTGLAAGQYQLRITMPGYAPFDHSFELSATQGLDLFMDRSADVLGISPEAAYADGQKLDLTKAFFPFGQQSQAGNCFFMKSSEAFAKPGAHIRLQARGVKTPLGDLGAALDLVSLVAETWDGERWQNVNAGAAELGTLFTASDERTVEFDLPSRLVPTEVAGEEGFFLRVRITWGGFARPREIKIPDSESFNVVEHLPKPLENLRIGYEYFSPKEAPQVCLTHNDFRWQDRTDDARRQGASFEPFSPSDDRTPTLYLGFDAPLPADLISLFFDLREVPGDVDGPPLRWEHWDGTAWLPLLVRDETRNLALPGMASILWPGVPAPPPATVAKASGRELRLSDPREGPRFLPGDELFIEQNGEGELVTVATSAFAVLTAKTPLSREYTNALLGPARLPRFGKPRTWIRARLQEDGEPRAARFDGIYLNAVWAAQVQTFENELIGSSNGQLNQVHFVRNTPVLPGQAIEVRELDGARARVELPLLLQDLRAQGMSKSDVRTVTDRRTGEVNQVWVRWQERPNLFFSGPGDRHYVIERSMGRVSFGDNRLGRIPQAGSDNIMARFYRAGGGLASNVGAGAINQILAGVLAKAVTNPRAAEGGADGELPAAVRDRGPLLVRNRRQALSADDYEALAREASPAVAVARALPTTHPSGRSAPGWVKLVVMPHSQDPKPQPSFELRRLVHDYLAVRMPAGVGGQVDVVGPDYLEVGVVAVVAPESLEAAGPVLDRVTATLQSFLNPLTGGPDGKGWPFGRDVYLSDVAATLESVAGVDYVATLELTLGGAPHGEVVQVPDDRIVVAGPLRVTLAGEQG